MKDRYVFTPIAAASYLLIGIAQLYKIDSPYTFVNVGVVLLNKKSSSCKKLFGGLRPPFGALDLFLEDL